MCFVFYRAYKRYARSYVNNLDDSKATLHIISDVIISEAKTMFSTKRQTIYQFHSIYSIYHLIPTKYGYYY